MQFAEISMSKTGHTQLNLGGTEIHNTIEILNRKDGAILHRLECLDPIPLYQIGTKIELAAARPSYYLVKDVYVGEDELNPQYPHRQTIVVDRVVAQEANE